MTAPLYRLTERCYIKPDDHLEASLHEAGAEFEYSGTPGRNFIALNAQAQAALALVPQLTSSAKNIAPRRGDPA